MNSLLSRKYGFGLLAMFHPTVPSYMSSIFAIFLTSLSSSCPLALPTSLSLDPFPFFCLPTGSLRTHPRARGEFLWHSFFSFVSFGDMMSTHSRIKASWEKSLLPTCYKLAVGQRGPGLSVPGWEAGKERSEASDKYCAVCFYYRIIHARATCPHTTS